MLKNMDQTDRILDKIDSLVYELSSVLLFRPKVTSELIKRATIKSADYVEKNMPNVMILSSDDKTSYLILKLSNKQS